MGFIDILNEVLCISNDCRYLGYRTTILLDRKRIAELFDAYQNRTLQWDAFSSDIREAHKGRMGAPTKRRVILDKPKEEDYFYANPHECLTTMMM